MKYRAIIAALIGLILLFYGINDLYIASGLWDFANHYSGASVFNPQFIGVCNPTGYQLVSCPDPNTDQLFLSDVYGGIIAIIIALAFLIYAYKKRKEITEGIKKITTNQVLTPPTQTQPVAFCPDCGAKADASDKFCQNCGKTLTLESSSVQQGSLQLQVAQVTPVPECPLTIINHFAVEFNRMARGRSLRNYKLFDATKRLVGEAKTNSDTVLTDVTTQQKILSINYQSGEIKDSAGNLLATVTKQGTFIWTFTIKTDTDSFLVSLIKGAGMTMSRTFISNVERQSDHRVVVTGKQGTNFKTTHIEFDISADSNVDKRVLLAGLLYSALISK